MVVNLESHIGEERRLGSAQVIGSAAVEDLAIVLDLENEVVDHALGHVHLAIDQKSQRDKVRVPVVQLGQRSQTGIAGEAGGTTNLVETSTWDDERNTLQSLATSSIIDLVHS